MASTYLTRTPSSATNRKTFTLSGWFKRGSVTDSGILFEARIDNNNRFDVRFDGVKLMAYAQISSSEVLYLVTSAVLRDPSAWYHVVVAVDTTQSTQSDRAKVYLNGSQVTSFSTNTNSLSSSQDTPVNTNNVHSIGANTTGGGAYDGYMAHVHFIDGTAYAASTFGSTATNGQWVPNNTPSVTYGTNGYFLKFTNASDLGEDFSGNNNDFTKSGSGDKTNDNPENVFATWNTVIPMNSTMTMAKGNLEGKTGSNYAAGASNTWFSTMGVSSGKWYAEFKMTQNSASSGSLVGVSYDINTNQQGSTANAQNFCQHSSMTSGWGYSNDGSWFNGATNTGFATYTTNDIIGVALDLDNNKLYWSKNGTYQNSANPATGSNGISIDANEEYFFAISDTSLSNTFTFQANFGNPIYSIASGNADGNGEGNFEYAPPTGYLALCTNNVSSELTLPVGDGSTYHQTATYSGTGSSLSVVNDGNSNLQPDWIWFKCRTNDENHSIHDSSRGVDNFIASNQTNAEATETDRLESFNSDGFTVNGGDDRVNVSGRTYVAWQWKANGGTTSSNSSGSITSTVQANTTAGFSIVTYTGTGANATVGHGLGKKPNSIFIKDRDNAKSWVVYNSNITALKRLNLDTTSASADASEFQDIEPTTSVFSIATDNNVNGSSQRYVAYCFAEIEGYSKFGKYTGNGSTDGPFAYTGFKPAWVMIKRLNNGTNGWTIYDSVRNPSNVVEKQLMADVSSAEEADAAHNAARDFLSNGFKIRETGNDVNVSGSDYLYMAFAENPFVDSSGVPTTAR